MLVLLLPWLLSRWGVLSLLLLRVQQGLVVAGEEDHLKEGVAEGRLKEGEAEGRLKEGEEVAPLTEEDELPAP